MIELMPAIELLDRLCVKYRILQVEKFYVLYFIASSSILDELTMYKVTQTTQNRAQNNEILYLRLYSDDKTIYCCSNENEHNESIKFELNNDCVNEITIIKSFFKLINL